MSDQSTEVEKARQQWELAKTFPDLCGDRGRINNLYERLGKPRRIVTVHDLRSALDQTRDGLPISPVRTQAIGCFMPTELVKRK